MANIILINFAHEALHAYKREPRVQTYFSAVFRNLIVYRNFYLNRNIDHVFYLRFNHIV